MQYRRRGMLLLGLLLTGCGAEPEASKPMDIAKVGQETQRAAATAEEIEQLDPTTAEPASAEAHSIIMDHINQELVPPGGTLISAEEEQVEDQRSTLHRVYIQRTYRFHSSIAPEQILEAYQQQMPAAGWAFKCSERGLGDPEIERLSCFGSGGPYEVSFRAHQIYANRAEGSHRNIIISSGADGETIVEVVEIELEFEMIVDVFPGP